MNPRTLFSIFINLAAIGLAVFVVWLRSGANALADPQSARVLVTLLLAIVIGFGGGLLSSLVRRSESSMQDIVNTLLSELFSPKNKRVSNH